MTGDESDGELVGRIVAARGRARDAEAELCRRFAPRVRLYGLKHLRSEERARDLVQSVLLAVLEAARAGRVEDPARIDRFVLGTCRNIAHRQRQLDARTQPADERELDVLSVAPEAERIESRVVVHCYAELEVRARTVLVMTFQRENSCEEIAALLETTPGNVRVLRHRALAQLRQCLDRARGAAA